MEKKKVRVRFAPSPTGGLHLGGVRTVLYNYLFAKQHGGDFIVRIEDTDQTRFVAGAEQYIFETLDWCGLVPDESPIHGGGYGPYRQSERKPIYRQYADRLIEAGVAYYAFDTAADLDAARKANPNFQYNHEARVGLRNSLVLGEEATNKLIQDGVAYTIRFKMPVNEEIAFTDLIRGEVVFNSSHSDDKVLLKADGMPTYHLAVIVDDYLMKITHSFRGEEWLPSAPAHILLWKYLFGLENMPQWAHLPLILKPDGQGKLSKRDGDRLGFPVFAMDWKDPNSGETTTGFRERGFLPEAFVNMLAMLGWNGGTEQEIFSIEELIAQFSIEKVHKGGAKFDFEKAKWFNQEWIKRLPATDYAEQVKGLLSDNGVVGIDNSQLILVIELVKDRCQTLNDFVAQAGYFFVAPKKIDFDSVRPKWDDKKRGFFEGLTYTFQEIDGWEAAFLESFLKTKAVESGLKAGDVMLPLRVMLVGGKFGPHIHDIMYLLGKGECISRIETFLKLME